jgi:aspartyl/glutamyl-tRNA(Asn/Gln) amidotransferase, C subunit
MAQISTDEVRALATLSSLLLSDQEIEDLRLDLANILSYVDALQELDTTDVEPTYQVTGLSNVWRDDVVRDDGVSREQLLNLSAEHTSNQIKVPKVL